MNLVVYKINPKKNTLNFFLLLTLIALLFQVYIAIKSEVVRATTQCASGNVSSETLEDNRTVVVTFTSATALAQPHAHLQFRMKFLQLIIWLWREVAEAHLAVEVEVEL